MHEIRRRHSAERRARNTSAAAITERAFKLAHAGDLKTAMRAALLAERLHRLEPKLRAAKKVAASRAAAAVTAARADLGAPCPPPPPAPAPKPFVYRERSNGPIPDLHRSKA